MAEAPPGSPDQGLDEQRIVALIREYDAMRGEMHTHRIPCPVCQAAERELVWRIRELQDEARKEGQMQRRPQTPSGGWYD